MPAPRPQDEVLPFKVRDRRVPGWYWAQNEVIDLYAPLLGAYGVAVYHVLVRHARENKVEGLSAARIAGLLRVSRAKVFGVLGELEKHGLVGRVVNPGGETTYVLLDLKAAPVQQVDGYTERHPSTTQTAPVHQVDGYTEGHPSTTWTGGVHLVEGTRPPHGRANKEGKTQDCKTPPPPAPAPDVEPDLEDVGLRLQRYLLEQVPGRLQAKPEDGYRFEAYQRHFRAVRVTGLGDGYAVVDGADAEARADVAEGVRLYGQRVARALWLALDRRVAVRVAGQGEAEVRA